MQHVELEWLGALLTYGEDLEPADSLGLIDNSHQVPPLNITQRLGDINLKTLKFLLNDFLLVLECFVLLLLGNQFVNLALGSFQ